MFGRGVGVSFETGFTFKLGKNVLGYFDQCGEKLFKSNRPRFRADCITPEVCDHERSEEVTILHPIVVFAAAQKHLLSHFLLEPLIAKDAIKRTHQI